MITNIRKMISQISEQLAERWLNKHYYDVYENFVYDEKPKVPWYVKNTKFWKCEKNLLEKEINYLKNALDYTMRHDI